MKSPNAAGTAKADGSDGDTTPGTRTEPDEPELCTTTNGKKGDVPLQRLEPRP